MVIFSKQTWDQRYIRTSTEEQKLTNWNQRKLCGRKRKRVSSQPSVRNGIQTEDSTDYPD